MVGDEEERSAPAEAPWEPEEWIDEGAVRDEAADAIRRGSRGPDRPRRRRGKKDQEDEGRSRRSPEPGAGARAQRSAEDEIRSAVGQKRAPRLQRRLDEAREAFQRGRFDEVRRTLRPVADEAPGVAEVRELLGLSLYRLGRWSEAAKELEAYRTLTGSVDEHPVLADCYRALKRYGQVDELWDELRSISPGAALMAEGRIVAAGALADQGRLQEAIDLLSPAVKPVRKAKEHHLRIAYALADLYERAGDLPRARELFLRVAASDPDFVDVAIRLQALD